MTEELPSANSPAIRDLQIDLGSVNGDLSEFINVKVDELSTRKKYSTKMKENIKCALIDKAGGTFLYVSLVLDDLNRTTLASQVDKKLQELPSDLSKQYDKILSQIGVECVETAISVLRWVTGARRPLTVTELAMARFLDAGEWKESTAPSEDLFDKLKTDFKCCEPLVYLDAINDTVNLLHQSVREYLLGRHLQENVNQSQYHVVTDRTNLLIFRTCWTYLSLEEFKRGSVVIKRDVDNKLMKRKPSTKFLRKHCFFRYASREWLKHALAANPVLTTDYEFKKDTLDNLPTLRDTWLRRAAAERQEVIVQRLLEGGAEPNFKNEMSDTPLSLAAYNGHEMIVKLLLEKGAEPNFKIKWGDTALLSAAENGHEALVKLLLEKDVEPNSKNKWGQTPLSRAARNGHETIVKLLLERGAEPNFKNNRSETPLSLASEKGHVTIVRLLLERDAEPDSEDAWDRTPLSLATKNGHEAIVKLLLEKGARPDSKDKLGRTPLSWATQNGHKAVVSLLKKTCSSSI